MKKNTHPMKSLLFISLALLALYVIWGNGLAYPLIMQLRLKKVLIFLLVGVSSSVATIAFQCIVNSRFLTPGILGIESFYRLIQTLLYFFGYRLIQTNLNQVTQFVLVVGIMVICFWGLSRYSWQNISYDLHTVLLIGMVIGMLLNSTSTFFQVLMDPNEYDRLQMKLFPTFQNVDTFVLVCAILMIIPILISLWRNRKTLEVLRMGTEQAVNLGIDTNKEIKKVFLQIIILSAISAALVGPMMFLGFTTANLAYILFRTYRMDILFIATSMLGFIALLFGQFIVEQLFQFQTNASIIIEWLGGILFFALLWKERKQA
ncbi:iron chelate uptake ABC transporter family permease subunit [Jeotgalibaca sp. A127]|uniref:iron chelate uptake ABC transporter family permease subunit n=1 Tax=Jeotgalibaca sp. A127 TaxID=3457324 RepID=UPI003FD6064E